MGQLILVDGFVAAAAVVVAYDDAVVAAVVVDNVVVVVGEVGLAKLAVVAAVTARS
jgi:hypothetical protein